MTTMHAVAASADTLRAAGFLGVLAVMFLVGVWRGWHHQ